MNPEKIEPVYFEIPSRGKRTWVYPWIGIVLGVAVGIFIGHPLAMVAYDFQQCLILGTVCNVSGALLHSFHLQMWPMMLTFSVFGGITFGVIGFVLKYLRENRLRLDTLQKEFELQVATLRHHYKNLAIGIQGFSGRVRRKLEDLEKQLHQCAIEDSPVHQACEALARNVEILEETSQRLSQTLGQELMFLKALTSESLASGKVDIYPLLIHAIQDLLDLRFRDKPIRVEINGDPLELCSGSLVFAFEPYAMEVILQNLLSNSMKFGDHIQVTISESDGWVRVGIRDNGPGLEVEKLKDQLLAPTDRHTAESTHLGLKVSLHLIHKSGGRLLVRSQSGGGAEFIIELPKHPEVRAK